ncbi:hypothetical protein Pmani_028594 [Petrolisthes manimaculis]|uniref:Ionotropic glutamate receptor L-glutamate and glycine-binding domain-containing protein n=1 Tax=Petrolisthes manimaculis TaxID=1843537 RepID=A0AAE1NZ80_9EUCA|nr:hypothetical protein Pmani_028594 [Petrolisthes manimaculis]
MGLDLRLLLRTLTHSFAVWISAFSLTLVYQYQVSPVTTHMELKLVILVLFVASTFTTAAPDGLIKFAAKWSQQAANMSDMSWLGVQVLQQVVEGPASKARLTLLLSPSLPIFVQNVILREQPLQFLSTGPLLHLVFFDNFPVFLNSMLLKTKVAPRNLLLVNLGSDYDASTLLMEPWLSGVYNLTLLTPVSGDPGLLAAFTLRPFCSPSPHYLGHWNTQTFSIWESLFPDRFPNTCQATFHLCSWKKDIPFLYLKSPDNKTAGVLMSIIEVLANKLNFSYTLSHPPLDEKWGVMENGKWVGLLGMLHRGECNFTLNCFYPSVERNEAFSFSSNIVQDQVKVFLRVPAPLSEWDNLMRPFSLLIWGLLVTVTILVSSYFAIQAVCQGRAWNTELGLLRAVVAQSAPLRSNQSPRLLMYLWLLTCLILCAAFTSTLVGIFTRPAFPPRIIFMDQLFADGKRLTRQDNGGFTYNALKKTPVNTLIDLYPEMDKVLASVQTRSHGFVGSEIYNSLTLMENNLKRIGNPSLDNPSLGNPSLGNPSLGNPSLDNPSLGNPSLDNPSLDNPSLDNPSLDNPSLGNPSLGNPSLDNPSLGNPSLDNPSLGNPSLGNPSLDNPSLGNPSLDNPSLDNPSLGNPSLDNPSLDNPSLGNLSLGNLSLDR